MSAENVAAVKAIYQAFATGDVPAVVGAMSPDIEWNEAENFPYADGNPYRGPAHDRDDLGTLGTEQVVVARLERGEPGGGDEVLGGLQASAGTR